MRRTNSNLSKKGSDKSSQPKAAQLYSRAASETNLQKKANPPPFNVANNNVMASVKKQLHNTVVAFGRTTRVKDAEMTKSTVYLFCLNFWAHYYSELGFLKLLNNYLFDFLDEINFSEVFVTYLSIFEKGEEVQHL